jgi:hypothetical protein
MLFAISGWLWEQLAVEAQSAVLDEKLTQQAVESMLVRGFNELMAKGNIFDEERFKSVDLRPETKEILKGITIQAGEDTIRVNRLLLEDAYPSELSRTRLYADEATKLQKTKPGRRVLLVGSNKTNPHDITEPVQWLMR